MHIKFIWNDAKKEKERTTFYRRITVNLCHIWSGFWIRDIAFHMRIVGVLLEPFFLSLSLPQNFIIIQFSLFRFIEQTFDSIFRSNDLLVFIE